MCTGQDSFVLEFYGIWDFYNEYFFFVIGVFNQNASPHWCSSSDISTPIPILSLSQQPVIVPGSRSINVSALKELIILDEQKG